MNGKRRNRGSTARKEKTMKSLGRGRRCWGVVRMLMLLLGISAVLTGAAFGLSDAEKKNWARLALATIIS